VENFSLIIPAAGRGARIGGPIPKPFIEIGGKTILEHTLSRFTGAEGLQQIIIATSGEWVERVQAMEERLTEGIPFHVAEGGEERQSSVKNALSEVLDAVDLVVVHDAVRPFVSLDILIRCLNAAAEYGAAISGIPVKDTIKRIGDGGYVVETPDRHELIQAQTPQVFSKRVLRDAFHHASLNDFIGTDDASLVEFAGGGVKVVRGAEENFKITWPSDLAMARKLLTDGF